MRELNGINAQIQQRIANRDPAAFSAASIYAELMKLRHAVTLAESQGSEVLKGYLAKLVAEGTGAGGSKASQRLAQDRSFRDLFERSVEWTHELHPKPAVALGLIREQLEASPDSRIILFATYRDTVQLLVDYLARERDRERALRRPGNEGRGERPLPEEADRGPDPVPGRGVPGACRHLRGGGGPRCPLDRPRDLLRGGPVRDPLDPAQGQDRAVGCREGRRARHEGNLRRGLPARQHGKRETDAQEHADARQLDEPHPETRCRGTGKHRRVHAAGAEDRDRRPRDLVEGGRGPLRHGSGDPARTAPARGLCDRRPDPGRAQDRTRLRGYPHQPRPARAG